MAKTTNKRTKEVDSKTKGKVSISYTVWKNEWRHRAKNFFTGIFYVEFTKSPRIKKTIQIPVEIQERLTDVLDGLNGTFTTSYYAKNTKHTKGLFSENDLFILLLMDALAMSYDGTRFKPDRMKSDILEYLKENEEELLHEYSRKIEQEKEVHRQKMKELQKGKRQREKEERAALLEENERLKERLKQLEDATKE